MFKLTVVSTILIVISSQVEGMNLGAIASSLLSHGLQPTSKISIGQGAYLRDTFRTNQLIPTFRRIKETFLQMEDQNFCMRVILIFSMLMISVIVIMMGIWVHGIRNRVKVLENIGRPRK